MSDVKMRCEKCGNWFESDFDLKRKNVMFETMVYDGSADEEDGEAFSVCLNCFTEIRGMFPKAEEDNNESGA